MRLILATALAKISGRPVVANLGGMMSGGQRPLPLLERVRRAATARLVQGAGPSVLSERNPYYTRLPSQNLITGIHEADFRSDFDAGDGGELQGKLPKFCAACSSAALAVNSFGPFRTNPENLTLAGLTGFNEARFEKKLPTSLQGIPPNLDFFASSRDGMVAVESKFTEFLTPKSAEFRDSYVAAVDRLAEPAWASVYRSLKKNPERFSSLDAAQLLKHYLGMRNSLSQETGRKVLLYLFWEPLNATSIPEFVGHRIEVEAFASEVRECSIDFMFLSYPELWNRWEREATWDGVGAHVTALRQRYDFSLSTSATGPI